MSTVHVYFERGPHRAGALGAGDEEDCFTAMGRRCGVWLTTEVLTGPTVMSTVVGGSEVEPYEVTGEDAAHRSFVVPALVAGGWRFT